MNIMQRFILFFIIIICYSNAAAKESDSSKVPSGIFTNSEISWLKDHRLIHIGGESEYPPFEIVDKAGNYNGIAGDYIDIFEDILGVKFEFVQGLSWPEVISGIQNGVVDIAPIMTKTEERSKNISFTDDYLFFTSVIVTRSDYPDVKSIANFKGKKWGVVEGYSSIAAIDSLYPSLQMVKMNSQIEVLKAVASGAVDGCQGNIAILSYLIEKYNLYNLKIAAPSELGGSKMAMGTRKDWPIFHTIINKALGSVPEERRMEIIHKWTPNLSNNSISDSSSTNFARDNSSSNGNRLLLKKSTNHSTNKSSNIRYFLIVLFSMLSVVGLILGLIKIIETTGVLDKTNIDMKKIGAIIIALIISLVLILAFVAIKSMREYDKSDIVESLSVALNSTEHQLDMWIKHNLKQLSFEASNSQFLELTEALLQVDRTKSTLLKSEELRNLYTLHNLYRAQVDSKGFFIISPDYITIASKNDSDIGNKNLLVETCPDLFARVFAGESLFIPPVVSDMYEGDNTSLFFAAPIKNSRGKVIAIIVSRRVPSEYFSEIFKAGRVKRSGETYAVSSTGQLLTLSRFEPKLMELGLIDAKNQSILNIDVRDPGYDIRNDSLFAGDYSKLPLTFMAEQLTAKKSGYNSDGYRDYRGVKVIGAWRWIDKYGFGISAEIDYDEAVHNYIITRNLTLGVMFITLLISILATLMSILIGERSKKSILKINEELEDRVIDRTKELETTLFQSELALELTKSGYWHVPLRDDPGFYISSKRGIEIFGDIPNDDYRYNLETEWMKYVEEGDADAAEKTGQIYGDSLEGKIPVYDSTYAVKRPIDGKKVWIHALGKIVRDENGVATDMWGVYQDITLEKEAEIRILENEEKFKTIFEDSSDGILLISKDSIIDCNNATLHLIGASDKDEFMKYHPSVYSPEFQSNGTNSAEQAQIYMEKALENGNIRFDWEHKNIKTGEVFPVEISLTPIMLNSEVVMIAVWHDLTERKKVEEALEASKNAAEEATKTKSEFLANMSHEIRTPMNAIIGMSHLVLKTDMSRQQKDYVSKIDRGAKNLLGIINDILDFSKIEAGKLSLEMIEFSLEDVLTNLSSMIALKAQEKGLEFLLYCETDVPDRVIGDPLRLGQILLNLCSNSVKFTATGEVIVQISLIEATDSNIHLKISVRDTGIGMTKEQKSRLFKSFSQADASTTRKFGGTGLGLAISKHLVEKMNGSFEVNTIPDKGTEFLFDAVFGTPKVIQISQKLPPVDLKGMSVLVVDDNETSRIVLQDLLSSMRFSVTLASTGMEAIAEVENRESPFDVILMDWKMPEMDGIETSRYIRSMDGRNSISTIIMVTAYGSETVMKQAQDEGFYGFLIKPVTASTLMETILEACGKTALNSDLPLITEKKPEKVYDNIIGAKILLVEDNEINQQIACELLESQGAEVHIAENGLIGSQKAVREKWSLVLMDIQMPVMDGYRASSSIRKTFTADELPIVAMTANAMAGDREKAEEAGMQDHVTKPVDPEELYEKVNYWALKTVRGDGKNKEKVAINLNRDIPESLYEIDGLNIKEGLARVGGNGQLYIKTLTRFVRTHAMALEVAKEALEDGDRETAIRTIHTLKGVAGTFGAKRLFELTAEFESQLNDGGDWSGISPEIAPEIGRLTLAIREALSISEDNEEEQSSDEFLVDINWDELKPHFNNLKELLEDDDTEASEILNSIEDEFPALQPTLVKIRSHIESYSFDEALEVLKELMEKLNK